MQAHKTTDGSAISIGLNGQLYGNLFDDGVALLADDADVVDVLTGGRELLLVLCSVCLDQTVVVSYGKCLLGNHHLLRLILQSLTMCQRIILQRIARRS